MTNVNIKVKDRLIGYDQPIFITAEIGASHMGNVQLAKEMIKAAAQAGCDGVDLFITSIKDFYRFPCPEWEKQSLDEKEWMELFKLADKENIVMYLTPLDPVAVKKAVELGSPMININSDDLNNPLVLETVAKQNVPVTCHDINMTLGEMEAAILMLKGSGCRDIIILHSTLESGVEEMLYQTANLRVIDTYKNAFDKQNVLVGCVEHTTSDFLIYSVVGREPALISKHIITEHADGAPDDTISVDIANLAKMVKNVRHCEAALGQGVNFTAADRYGKIAEGAWTRHKILVASHDIPAGSVIKKEDIAAKRPAVEGGMHPWKWKLLIGARTKRKIFKDEILDLNMFENFQPTSYRFYDLEYRRFEGQARQSV